jgi:hypothetical protein
MGKMRSSIRRFEGDEYHIYGSGQARKKSGAKREAERLRNIGHPTRVVHVDGGYRVYSSYRKRH